ncbi:glycosyltransferase family 2 protein [Actibacterium sp. XHP0104]|uniref:glycosyltransferase family 2 protein n=1 Tax=Actibacterium sp. XHP0104 TaxID=2984335 RepID=UPI0021E960EC|nr:glycosyltransferase [Actibacterium sp. XHP0104]MCV2881844.1 glycosyltransferase [Actibacterium sp. XHP0104]
MPKVSVIIPAYNAQRYLRPAVDSVLAQGFADFECIAIDDGSTDGTLDILNEMAARDARLRVVSRPNKGLIATLNEGLDLAQGDYIARMDADDICTPDRFAKQVAFLDAHPGHAAVGMQAMLIDDADRRICVLPLPQDHAGIDAMGLETKAGLWHPSTMIRAEAAREIGGYRPDYVHAEDVDFWLRLAEVGQLANLPDVGLYYRMHTESIGNSKRDRQKLSAWTAARDAAARRGLEFTLPQPEPSQPGAGLSLFAKWGWWALHGGNPATARHYALRELGRAPFRKASWSLAVCALRGH